MRSLLRRPEQPTDLLGVIQQVRRRWKYKLLLRGAVGLLALGFMAFVLSAWGLEAWRFSAGSIVAFRIILPLVILALIAWFIVRPMLRRADDDQVALYLEEHEPSLQAEIISAIEASRLAGGDASPHSAALVRKLVESAVEKCQRIEYGRNVERTPLKRYGVLAGAVAAAAIALFTLGPAYLRHAASALLVISRNVQAATPYRIEVSPGNATVPKGVDQTITAKLDGFEADQAVLMVRKSAESAFERVPLIRSENADTPNQYEGMLFDLAGHVDYFVEAAGVKSSTYTLKVIDLPYVQKLELEYHFPAHTGLQPRKIEDGGDIAVLKGTEVRVRITPTMSAPGGQILLHDKDKVALTAAPDGTLSAKFVADRDGFYRVELDAPTGERVSGSPQYTIDVLTDQAPSVSISKPGRDTNASPIEEVFVEARAEDDFGVRNLELVYSVNGGPEKTLQLFEGRNRLPEVTAGHTFYLEELNVQPGDFVSYYARAADNDAVNGAKRASSDLYFLQVRPLRKEFRRAESQGGGGGGGGNQEVGALSQQQRQIIAATFNINRDRKTMSADKLRENSTVVALSQARLREQVEGLVTRMNSRLVEQDPSFKKIADLLPQAVAEMKNAEAKLQKADPQGALEPEQKALQFLQKAEEEYEVQVSTQQGGGGGGGNSAMAQDLADLFELELDRMSNQYETAQRAQQQQSDQQLDELMEKLKELARRQEQEAERQRRRAAAGQQQSGGGGSQRGLAEQVEEAARRLEQLSREQNRPELMASARQLREAADAMRQSSAEGQAGAAQAAAALERLQEAQRRLQQNQSGRGERDVKDAVRQAEEIAREQQQIADEVRGLEQAGAGRQDKVQQLSARKDQLDSRVAELEKHLDRAAGELARSERETARKLSEAAGSIRDNRLRDKIRYSRSMIRAGVQASDAAAFEGEIAGNIGEMQKRVDEAAAALGASARTDQMASALERAQDLARGLESMDQRMRERSGRNADQRAQQQGREGQRGEQGQQGQQGQNRDQQGERGEGQEGQQGQRGQQGQQSGQGQGQGQRGEQGQQGREGQQGQQGGQDGRGGQNQGEPSRDGRGGLGDTSGQWQAGGGSGSRRPGRFTQEDIRQFSGEARQWTREAEQLSRQLRQQRIDPKELDEILRNLRRLEDERAYQDVEELARLQTQVSEGMKRFEYGLRRKIEGAGNQVLLSGSDEVPEQFRKLVEQYYKSLSKGPTPEKK